MAHRLIAIEQENSKDLRLKYELWHQKEDQYIQLVDDLHKRIDSMEKKTSHTITYIINVLGVVSSQHLNLHTSLFITESKL